MVIVAIAGAAVGVACTAAGGNRLINTLLASPRRSLSARRFLVLWSMIPKNSRAKAKW
jgi:hypothetical protein